MKIKVSQYGDNQKTDVAEYVDRQLDGRDYDNGAMEAASATADNATGAIAKLVGILASKGILTAQEVVSIAGDYADSPEFIQE